MSLAQQQALGISPDETRAHPYEEPAYHVTKIEDF